MNSQDLSAYRAARKRSGRTAARLLAATAALALLAACEEGAQLPGFLQAKDGADAAQSESPNRAVKLVERDVEAPDVFQVTEAGLWDGRPSLGGVWVAHPDVKDPERVIIRNPSNGKFVIGALFRKERANPGPRLQVSSDAAAALKLVAGQPTNLNVTALRREQAPEAAEPAPASSLDAPDGVTETELDPVTETAAAAIDAAPEATTPPPAPKPKPAPKPASGLERPYIQIGIFSIEKNARNTAATMRQKGLIPTVKEGSSSGKKFWRVVVGPATSVSERAELLKIIKSAGFIDAYAVTH
ncbi:SPOR domain-containing protein [Primorskyibacter aestuariivivens]|uniref:SPOR domain-containing protein n=1 Tax=Primorskyibacter aestuariivivens TaxID=1888912 RepID=UPI0023010FA7|nr:SPOR domain-containing protein [Primorskyibacter aestuariivivens]MDA7428850.1 SPOR domain-containing protein [Primorskyibacter aestuariivivens]